MDSFQAMDGMITLPVQSYKIAATGTVLEWLAIKYQPFQKLDKLYGFQVVWFWDGQNLNDCF
jgi:hypothetical protein